MGRILGLGDGLVDGGVLLVVLLEGQDADDGGEDTLDELGVGVAEDHAGDAARDVVDHAGLLDLQKGLKLLQNGGVLGNGLVGRLGVVDELAGGVGSVGLGEGIGVGKAVGEDRQEGVGEGSDGLAHVLDGLGDDTNGGGALEGLLGAGELEDGLLEDLPHLGKVTAKSGGEAENDIEGGVDDEPVELGRALGLLLLLLVAEVLLAGVGAGDEGAQDGDALLEEVIVGEDGGAAGLEGGGNVAVDLGDDAPESSHTLGGINDHLAKVEDNLVGLLLGREASLPLGAGRLLEELPDTGVRAPEGGDGRLAGTVVGVLGKRGDLAHGIAKVLSDGIGTARVGDDVAENLESNLLLKSNGGDTSEVVEVLPVGVLIHALLVVLIDGLEVELLAAREQQTLGNILLLETGDGDGLLLELEAVEKTLEDTGEEVRELAAVDLGQRGPEDEAGLLEAGVVEAESLLAGLHEVHDVGLELLSTDSVGDAAHGVADRRAESKSLLAVLDGDVLAESAHDILEVGLELLAAKSGGDGANGTGSGGLDGEVVVAEKLAHGDNQLGAELLDQLVVKTLANEGVESAAGSANDSDALLVGGAGDGLEVGEEGADEVPVLGRELVGHLVGEVDETDEGSVTDRAVLVVQELENDGQQRLELGSNEVGSTLSGSTERENGGLAVAGVGVLGELSELLKEGHNDLAGRQVAGQLVNERQSGSGGRVVVVLVISVNLSDDLHALDHEQSTHVLHGLELHAAVAGTLAEEGQGLRASILLDLGVDGEVDHEVDEVLEVGSKEGGVVGQERLEDLEDVSVLVIVALRDGVLEDLDHGLDELLNEVQALGVLLGVDEHQQSADGLDGAQADVCASRVDDGLLDEAEKLLGLLGEVGGVVLEESEENVGANLAVSDVVGGVQGQKSTNKVLALAILKVEADGASQKARLGVARRSRLVVQNALQNVLLGKLPLVGGQLRPVPGSQAQGLDGGQLTDRGVIVGDGDLDQEEKRLGLGVVVLLQLGRDGLDLLGIG
ncbi:hypothetical protein ColTof4_00089 [Colletotrichum tofieldiae]|nr:hypothetical protein ColTof3_07285 [Colletotrichum tofieldiae]GKT67666.1 hypothetical protein ColTof4_00089 [Colletotrichum tofieldiae]